jgi:hypothetical protein
VDERFSNIGGMYQQARASRQARPFGPVPRDHGKRIDQARKTEQIAEALIRKVKVGALLKRPVTETGRPRRRATKPTMAERHYHVAGLLRGAGRYADAQDQESRGYNAGRDLFLSHLARKALKKARDPRTRFD